MLYISWDNIGWLTRLADSWGAAAIVALGFCLRIIRRRITRLELTQDSLKVEFCLDGVFGQQRAKAKRKSVSAK